jgi:predicted phosphoadenosine phosphosulfate sulfurtransferase
MGRARLGVNVVQAALDRLEMVYSGNHRVIVAVSGGKDSVVCLELAIMVARKYGKLPVEVATQDEEAAFPGTYESLERMAERPEVNMRWFCMQQPMLNVFNREMPYWWCHDPQLPPEQWLRKPPDFAEFVEEKSLELMVAPQHYPVEYAAKEVPWDPEDKRQRLVTVVGLRVQESVKRLLGLFSAGGPISKSNKVGMHMIRPIYDWSEGDVWKFIADAKADYNKAYDVLYRAGVKKNLRMGPPTMTLAGINQLQAAARAWPTWFEKLCIRVPGTRTAAAFGKRAVTPRRKHGETWQQCFERECLGEGAPEWIRERSLTLMQKKLHSHGKHATAPFPENQPCHQCGVINTWKGMALAMWNGDPYGQKTMGVLPLIEPSFFRPGSGSWGLGKPSL